MIIVKKNKFYLIRNFICLIAFYSFFIPVNPVFSQETEIFEEFKDTERYKVDSNQKKVLKMRMTYDTSKQVRMKHRNSIEQNFKQKDSLVKHRLRMNRRNCDSNDVFIDKDGDGINDNRLKGMGLGKRKGLGKGKCKKEIK